MSVNLFWQCHGNLSSAQWMSHGVEKLDRQTDRETDRQMYTRTECKIWPGFLKILWKRLHECSVNVLWRLLCVWILDPSTGIHHFHYTYTWGHTLQSAKIVSTPNTFSSWGWIFNSILKTPPQKMPSVISCWMTFFPHLCAAVGLWRVIRLDKHVASCENSWQAKNMTRWHVFM